jgi:predicted Rossmann fold flavoprotein
LSGPVVMDVSRAVTAAEDPKKIRLVADFMPSINSDQLEENLRQLASREGGRLVVSMIAEYLPRRMVEAVFDRAQIPTDRRAAELSTTERLRLIEQLKRCEIRVTGTRGFEKAEVTAGGVALDEVDSRTMQSKLVPNLYLAGEILDLDGFIGGYNFQAAFSTGWVAGESV